MASRNPAPELKRLATRDLTSKDKTKVVAAVQRLTEILSNPPRGHPNASVFQCLTPIFLTDNHRHFTDEQLRNLLDAASKSRLLTMTENHLLDSWSRNIEEREFEPLDEDEQVEGDEDQWTDETTETESESEEEDAAPVRPKSQRVQFATTTAEIRVVPSEDRRNRPKPNGTQQENSIACFKCGEKGHKKIDCPMKTKGFELIFNEASMLMNSNQNDNERKNLFNKFCRSIEQIGNRLDETLRKTFVEKEALFYSLVCHVAQRRIFFSDDEFSRLFDLRQTILPARYKELNRNREKFTRQRPLKPFDEIEREIRTKSELHPTIFNDFEEILCRAKTPLDARLFDLLKYFSQSSIHVEPRSFDFWTTKILFGAKKNLFDENQLAELRAALEQRKKRSKRSDKKTVWKERLNSMKTSPSNVDLDRWIAELSEILASDDTEKPQENSSAVDHGLWYFNVLSLCSCFSLTKSQYETLLNNAVRSFLFNKYQKYFLQLYLDEGQPPVSLAKLNEFQRNFLDKDLEKKRSTFDEMRKVLLRKKPETPFEKEKSSVAIPFVDNHVRSQIIALVQLVFADREKLPSGETKVFFDEILSPSNFIRPLTSVEERQLKSIDSNILSIDDLQEIRQSLGVDWPKCVKMLKQRSFAAENDEVLQQLTEIFIDVFSSPNEFSLEQCDELKALVHRAHFDRTRYELLNSVYDEYRRKNVPIDAKTLNELSTKILAKDLSARGEFFDLLNRLATTKNVDETIDFEVIRCLVCGTIFVLCQSENSDSAGELKTLVDRHSKFFATLFTPTQFALLNARLTELTRSISSLIDAVRTNANDENFSRLAEAMRTLCKDKKQFDEVLQFVLSTFDDEFLSVGQTLKLTQILHQHVDPKDKATKNLLQFLLHLLQTDFHQSPTNLLARLDEEIEEKFAKILRSSHASHAPYDWKEKSIELIEILLQRNRIDEKLLQQSPMFQTSPFKERLAALRKPSTNENSEVHRDLFRQLESADPDTVRQLHQSLVDEKLPPNVFLKKFIQAIELVVKNPKKYPQFALDDWTTLIAKNRGKIFTSDTQCDNLLLLIFLERWNFPKNFLQIFDRLSKSKAGKDRQDLFQKLSLLLKQTRMKSKDETLFHLPTIANELFHVLRDVIFNQRFSDEQVRTCIDSAKASWLLNDDQRKQLGEIS